MASGESVLLKRPPRCMAQVAQNCMKAWALDIFPTTPEVGGPSNWVTQQPSSLPWTVTDSLPSQSGTCRPTPGSPRKAKGSHPCQLPLVSTLAKRVGGVPVCTLVHPEQAEDKTLEPT